MEIRLIVWTVLAAALLLSSTAYAAGDTTRLHTCALNVCFTTPPSGWAGTLRATFPTMGFSVAAVAPASSRAYGSVITCAARRRAQHQRLRHPSPRRFRDCGHCLRLGAGPRLAVQDCTQ